MVSMGDIRRWDDLLKARHALFLLDACFSGLAGTAEKASTRDLKVDQLMRPAHHLIAAGTGDESTIASDRWGGSIFTESILLAARGAADASTLHYPPDGVVSLNELIEFVQTRVAREKHIAGWSKTITPQLPDLRGSDGQFFFLPKNSEGSMPKIVESPPPTPEPAAKSRTESKPPKTATVPPAAAPEEGLTGSFDGEWNLEFIYHQSGAEMWVNSPMFISENKFGMDISSGGDRGTLIGEIIDDDVLKVTANIKTMGAWWATTFQFFAPYKNDEFRSSGEAPRGSYELFLTRDRGS